MMPELEKAIEDQMQQFGDTLGMTLALMIRPF
jgi:hypothetical protein